MSDSPVCAKCFDAHRRAINRENRWATGAERKRCAKIAEEVENTNELHDPDHYAAAAQIAAAIRGLGDEGETNE